MEFTKRMPVRCQRIKKRAYGNVYEYPLFVVTIPSTVAEALDLTTNDMVEFHVVEDEDTVECDMGFLFNEEIPEEDEDVLDDDAPH